MSEYIGSFDAEEQKELNDNETIDEFHNRLRNKELEENTKELISTSFKCLRAYIHENNKDVFELSNSDIVDWCNWMLNKYEPRTAETYLNNTTRVIGYLKKHNYIGGQGRPFEKVQDLDLFDYDRGRDWPEIEYEKFIVCVLNTKHPKKSGIFILFSKTGIRLAELINLDERDININHPISKVIDDPRSELVGKSNSIYIDSSITEDISYNGEVRKHTNKPNSHRILPIDQEAADFLGWYLAGKPRPTSPANPLFTKTNGLGERYGVARIQQLVDELSQRLGYNISPHFFRHWYTSQMRSRLSPGDIAVGNVAGVVKGLRGDSDEDTIDTYTHEWVEGVEHEYNGYDVVIKDSLPKFLPYTNKVINK